MIESDFRDSTLFLASRQGNISEIKKIAESRGIARRVDLSMQDASGQTALHIGRHSLTSPPPLTTLPTISPETAAPPFVF